MEPITGTQEAELGLMALEQCVAGAREQLSAVQALLEDLPAIFEQRFLGRLEPLLEQRQRLLNETSELRQHLRELQRSGRPLRALEGSAAVAASELQAAGDGRAATPSLRQRLLAALGRSGDGREHREAA
jgi:hypothetical protein